MRKIINFIVGLIIILFIGFTIISCDKKDGNNPDAIQFTDLFAESDTVFVGDTTTVTAVASGEGLSYIWSASKGDIDGFGSTVKYLAPPCQPGDFVVSCTAKDISDNKKTRSITIHVKLF